MRDIDIKSYIPPFLLKYSELKQLYESENPEFKKLNIEADNLLDNQFIGSTNEKGIARYEALLGISGMQEYSLEERQIKVYTAWIDDIPYTFNTLKERIERLCGKGNFTLLVNNVEHKVIITTHLEYQLQSEGLERMLDIILPANMVLLITNSFDNTLQTDFMYAGGGVVTTDYIELTE
nr:MAG TPA: tail protein [Caudoviricetes sp.]